MTETKGIRTASAGKEICPDTIEGGEQDGKTGYDT